MKANELLEELSDKNEEKKVMVPDALFRSLKTLVAWIDTGAKQKAVEDLAKKLRPEMNKIKSK